MLYLTESDVRSLLSMRECVRLMRETFAALAAGSAINQSRRRMLVPTGAVLHSMAGAIGNYFGTKIYAAHAKHGAHFFFHLFDAETAKPLALIEANQLGQIRTGAASGYATDLLAAPDARTLGVIGSGFQARAQIEAILAVRPLERVLVWSRDAENVRQFAAECGQAFGIVVEPAADAEIVVRNSSIVVTATFAKEPVLEAGWVQPGTHINAMGSNQPQRRELPADLIARASVIAVDSIEQAKIESGDLLLAWSPEEWNTQRLVELKDVTPSPRDPAAITIFKSNGLGVEDVAAAAYIYERARASGLGSVIASQSQSSHGFRSVLPKSS